MQCWHGPTSTTVVCVMAWHNKSIVRSINREGSCCPSDDSYNNKLVNAFLSIPERSRPHAMLAWPHISHKCVSCLGIAQLYIVRSIKWVGSCWSGVVTHTTTKLMMVFLANPERYRSHAMLAWPNIYHSCVCHGLA